jgi:dihydrofolate synthase/folylpolyglutamate synthase
LVFGSFYTVGGVLKDGIPRLGSGVQPESDTASDAH